MHNKEIEVGDLISSPKVGLYLVIEVKTNTKACIRLRYLSSALTGIGDININAEVWYTLAQACESCDTLYKAVKA